MRYNSICSQSYLGLQNLNLPGKTKQFYFISGSIELVASGLKLISRKSLTTKAPMPIPIFRIKTGIVCLPSSTRFLIEHPFAIKTILTILPRTILVFTFNFKFFIKFFISLSFLLILNLLQTLLTALHR